MEFTPSTDLKSDILRLIEWRGDGLSFIEICQHLPDARGDLPIIFEPNLVVWVDVSDLLIS